MKFLIGLNRSQKGSNMTEYALLAALIAVAGIVSMRALGNQIACSYARTTVELGGELTGGGEGHKPCAAFVQSTGGDDEG